MLDCEFRHNDVDSCHDKTLTLHDCVAEKIDATDGRLRFMLSDGFWITPFHSDNESGKTVRTDAAIVDFYIDNINDVVAYIFTRNIFNKTEVDIWEISDLIRLVNSGRCRIEFIYQYRSYFEQMWECYIKSDKKPYFRECQLHLPGAEAVYRWNNIRPERQW